jgi:hypothetical protein
MDAAWKTRQLQFKAGRLERGRIRTAAIDLRSSAQPDLRGGIHPGCRILAVFSGAAAAFILVVWDSGHGGAWYRGAGSAFRYCWVE